MSLRITIDVFSGRPNPIVEVSGKQAKEILERLKPEGGVSKREVASLMRPHLGYRGLIVEQIGVRTRSLPRTFRVVRGTILGPEEAYRTTDEEFEDFLFHRRGPLGRAKVATGFHKFLAREIARFHRAEYRPPHKVHKPPRCRCAPDYEPNWWNDAGQKQFGNNCYNYSTNYRTDTFAQPGLAAGAEYTAFTCASMRPAAVADDLIAKPGAKNRCPEDGHLVALVIAPGFDFHWYRKGEDGMWTHKPGDTPATNVDNSGHLIPDPRTADRGPYTNFCTFMIVKHGHIKIR
jgi:hypothetical protein